MKGIEKTAVFIVVAAIFGIVTLFIMLTSGQKVLAFILFGGEMSKRKIWINPSFISARKSDFMFLLSMRRWMWC